MLPSTSLGRFAALTILAVVAIGSTLTAKADSVGLSRAGNDLAVADGLMKADIAMATTSLQPLSTKVEMAAAGSQLTLTSMTTTTDSSQPKNTSDASYVVSLGDSDSECGDSDEDSDRDGDSDSEGACGGGGGNDTTPTPEPATLLLLGTGLAGLASGLRRRMASKD